MLLTYSVLWTLLGELTIQDGYTEVCEFKQQQAGKVCTADGSVWKAEKLYENLTF